MNTLNNFPAAAKPEWMNGKQDDTVIDRPPVREPAKEAKIKPKTPQRYQILILNDDTTPMDMVVDKLKKHFRLSAEKAGACMKEAHKNGTALVAVFPKDVAETKTQEVNTDCAGTGHPMHGRHGFPHFIELRFTCQPE